MKVNRLIFKIHSLLGLMSGIFILAISLTGSLIVFWDENEKLLYPELTCVSGGVQQKVSVDLIYQKVLEAYPHYYPYRITHLENSPNESIEVGIQRNDFEEYFSVYVNPYTGEMLGELKNNVNYILVKIHYTLFMGKVGEFLAAIFAMVLIASIITGSVVYRKYLIKALLLKVPIKFRNWRRTSSDLHRILGVWSLLFNFILAFSGFWMMLYTFNFSSHFSAKEVSSPPLPLRTSIEHAIDKTKESIPGIMVNYVSLPRKKDDVLKVLGDAPGEWYLGEYASEVVFNAETGKIENIKQESSLTGMEKFEAILYTLHFGQYGGLFIKIFYCLVGLATSLISISGFFLWYRRHKGKKKNKAKKLIFKPSSKTIFEKA